MNKDLKEKLEKLMGDLKQKLVDANIECDYCSMRRRNERQFAIEIVALGANINGYAINIMDEFDNDLTVCDDTDTIALKFIGDNYYELRDIAKDMHLDSDIKYHKDYSLVDINFFNSGYGNFQEKIPVRPGKLYNDYIKSNPLNIIDKVGCFNDLIIPYPDPNDIVSTQIPPILIKYLNDKGGIYLQYQIEAIVLSLLDLEFDLPKDFKHGVLSVDVVKSGRNCYIILNFDILSLMLTHPDELRTATACITIPLVINNKIAKTLIFKDQFSRYFITDKSAGMFLSNLNKRFNTSLGLFSL